MRTGEPHEAGASVATGGNWPREELFRLSAVMQQVSLRKTAIYQKFGGAWLSARGRAGRVSASER